VAQALATNLFFPPDPDDSWQMDRATAATAPQSIHSPPDAARQVVHAGGGYKMIRENPKVTINSLSGSLHFQLLAPDDQPAPIEPYMGMLGHAVVRRRDGTVFAHVHPVGTFSMAAQEFLVKGQPPKHSTSPTEAGVGSPEQSSSATNLHRRHADGVGTAGSVSFPYAFPEPGSYRCWVQMKTKGRILTGVFDTTVAPAN
jgi:hypothetical protein